MIMNAETPKVAAAKPEVASTKAEAKVVTAKKIATAKPASKAISKSVIKAADKKVAESKKVKKEAKIKVVRDSFTMPQSEYQKIADIKEACLKTGMHVKKSEVLRAGLQALTALSAAQLKSALAKLDKIQTGRPKKH
jgi:DNA-binding transcriptional regulator YiaG